MYFTNNTLRLEKKVLVCILVFVILSISLCSNLNTSYAAELIPEPDQYLEFRVVSVRPYPGKDKQVIAELWAYNIEFQGFELSLQYDSEKLEPSDLYTNDYIDKDRAESGELLTYWAEEELKDDSDMTLFEYIIGIIRYFFSLLLPIDETSSSENIIVYPDKRVTLKADENGVLLGRYSYRLFNGTIDNTTFDLDTTGFLETGIRVWINSDDEIIDPSVFRITLDYASNDANLEDILIDNESIVNFIEDLNDFDENLLDYELEILEEKEEISLKPILADDKATMIVRVEVPDPDNEGQYIYEEIEINEEDEDYTIPLSGLGKETKIQIVVTAEDEEATKTYTVTIKQSCGSIIGKIITSNLEGKYITDIKVYEKGAIDWNNLIDRTVLDNSIKTVTSNEDGTYEIRLVPGEYDLIIDKPGYLDHIIISIKIEKNIAIDLGEIKLKPGDINKDEIVNLLDLMLLYESYGVSSTGTNLLEADFNEDEIVNLLDLMLLYESYGVSRSIQYYSI